jgi:hypothetical protein
MTDLRHQIDLALAALRMRGMEEAARVVGEFVEQADSAAPSTAEGATYATDREAIEAALAVADGLQVDPLPHTEVYRMALRDFCMRIRDHLARVQPAATVDATGLISMEALDECVVAYEFHRYLIEGIGDDNVVASHEGCMLRALNAFVRQRQPRPAAEREGEAMAVLRELLESMDHVIASRNEVDPAPANQRLDSAIDRARALLSATPAPQPAAPIINHDDRLPCDVRLPPATTIAKGCTYGTLLNALSLEGRPSFEEAENAAPVEVSAAARDVLAERERQQSGEGRSIGGDDAYTDGQLARAATAYCQSGSGWLYSDVRISPAAWPFPDAWWKPKGKRRDLVRAGALILAEIERLDRAAVTAARTPGDKS